MGSRYLLGLAMLPCCLATSIHAQEAQGEPPGVMQQLYECRTIADPVERLACYDARVSAVQNAEAARDIRVVDREQVRETRRGLFGISLGGIGDIFGGDDDDSGDDAVNQIEATLSAVERNGSGRLVYTLDNGQVWVQTDSSAPGRSPRAGQAVVVRRASLGSFMISVEGRPGVRVQRIR